MKKLTSFCAITAIMLLVSGLITSSAVAVNITVRARGTTGAELIRVTVSGIVGTWTVTTEYADYSASTANAGDCLVRYLNDANEAMSVQIDYIIVDGDTRQAEDQEINTGCSSSYSEWMYCSGYINFGYVGKNLSVSPTSLSLAAPADSNGTFNVTSNTDWSVSSDQTWLTPSPTSDSNNGTVTVTAQANMSTSPRTATVTVSGTGVSSKTVTVTQSEMLSVSPTELTLGAAENSSSTFDITSGTSWTVASDQNWLTVEPNSGSNNATITCTAQENDTGAVRMATVTVSAAGITPLTVSVAQSGSIDASYEIGTWSGFRTAAITYTFDDGYMPGLYNTAIPMFNEPNFNYKLTAFPVTSWCGSYWSNLTAAAAAGHEVGNHTVTHNDNWCSWSESQQEAEYVSSQSTINSYTYDNECITAAYPFCCIRYESMVATYFIAARTCSSTNYNPATPSNFFAISSDFLGTAGTNTLAGIITLDEAAAAGGGWMVYTIHALDGDSGYSPLDSNILRQSLDYLASHRSTYWVNTFGNVVKYIKERDSVSVSETSNTGDIISVLVTDTLNNTIYNYPLTIRRPLPTGWDSALVKQNGSEVNSSIVTIGPTQYVMFDAVPDGGDVLLTRTYGDFLENGIVDINDLSLFCDVWMINDCDETEGIDLDDDCNVNFYEFAVFANNWMIEQ